MRKMDTECNFVYFNNNVNFDKEWQRALMVVKKMLSRENVSKREWHDLFTTLSQITSWVEDGDKKLMQMLHDVIERHVFNVAQSIHSNNNETTLLRAYVAAWENFSVLTYHLPLPFQVIERQQPRYSDRYKVEPTNIVRNDMLECWNRVVFSSISDRLLHASMKLIECERNNELIDSRLIIGVRESFVNLFLKNDREPPAEYIRCFEKNYLHDIEIFYKCRTAEILDVNGVLNYMIYAAEKLAEEEARGKKYLDFSFKESYLKLSEKCVKVLVIQYQEQFLAEGPSLIANNEIQRLNMMYRLINRTPDGISTLLDTFSKHIKSEGLNAMRGNAETILQDSEKFVEQLLNMYNVFSALVQDAFCNDPRFLTVRDQAFQDVINNTEIFRLELNTYKNRNVKLASAESKCPELLANYCDLLLRKSALTKKFMSDEIDKKLNNVLLLLKYVSNKDVFMRYHKTNLSRRLILELVADQEKEEGLVNKFREAGMPADYVNKLFRMLQDIEVNKDLNASFKASIGSNNNYKNMADCVNLKILNAGAWSRNRDNSHLTLPHELEEVIPEVEDFYRKQHSGRNLNWAHHWSTGTISFANKVGKFDIEVTTYQMAVLFAWNGRPEEVLSFESLRLATNMSDTELIRTLMTLVNFPKLKSQVLLTNADLSQFSLGNSASMQKVFSDSTAFWINQNFCVIKNERTQNRGKINLIGRLQLNQDMSSGVEEEHSDILRLRVYRVQEGIVKIMKMRKQLNQAQLQTELVEVLKNMFLPSKKMIKEQIEWLIENHYLKRLADDINTFVYIT